MQLHATLALLASAASLASAQPCGRWEVIPTPMPVQAERALIRDIVNIGPGDAWAVGDWSGYVDGSYQSFAMSMHWDGAQWTLIDTPQPAPCGECHNLTLWGVDATGPNDVWACGHQNIQAPDGFVGTHMLIMHWDGDGWKVLDTPVQVGASGDLLWRVEAIAPDDVWFFGENWYSGFPLLLDLAIALHWDGSNLEFTEVPIVNFKATGYGDGNSLHSGSALSPDDMWAVGAGGDGDEISCDLSQIHHWDGNSWTHIPSGPPDGCFYQSLDAVRMISHDDVWAGGEFFDGDYHGLALHWQGQQWVQEPTPIGITDLVGFASDDVYAFGGGVARWDGQAWALIESFPGVDGPSITGADAAGPCDIWAGGRQFDGDRLVPFTVHLAGQACTPDLDGNGALDLFDFLAFTNLFNAGDPRADLDGNSALDLFDFLTFTNLFNAGC
jgi:hypothetical protein